MLSIIVTILVILFIAGLICYFAQAAGAPELLIVAIWCIAALLVLVKVLPLLGVYLGRP